MTDTQMLYVPRQEDGTAAGKSVLSSFTKWSNSGRDNIQDFATPEPSGHLRPGLPSYTIRRCANGHQGAITVTLQRVNDERRSGNYIIRRSDPSHDISTVPPEFYRTKPHDANGVLRIINHHWVTPLAGEPGLPYVFEFMNVDAMAL
ncbi:hypothetical protein LTR53_013164 [Teratosphaeriaceae sp. CCFEE 6253]|nr:hypothetical protein LTR53_013164 [Teratosphaeriaceae sp. CCFEE 6253]